MRKIAICLLSIFILSACNTMSGFGKDVKHVGNKVENSADEHK
jgi:predicted small secreted protein